MWEDQSNLMPRTVLGMTLYNNARHVREAADSILAQTHRDFVLLMLDDGSSDEVEAIARDYERQDPRVRYFRHVQRQGMVPTWKEVVEIGRRDYPQAEYFAWVSDHDRWDPRWLARMLQELDTHPDAVLAYPQTLRIDEEGVLVAKEPRAFDTSGAADADQRWRAFCWKGFGSGDMVYGLMRVRALVASGIFRSVMNPDRLLIAELSRQGHIRQVPEPLWLRRQSMTASVGSQKASLFADARPPRFNWPPSLQHAVLLRQQGFTVPMIANYVVASVWRAGRKTETSKSIGRGVDNAHFVKKLIKKGFRHAVYYALVGGRMALAKCRRAARKAVYEVLMFTHRAGLRGRTNTR
jgi:glycosyltransferase involved in cell wall biosynthesis